MISPKIWEDGEIITPQKLNKELIEKPNLYRQKNLAHLYVPTFSLSSLSSFTTFDNFVVTYNCLKPETMLSFYTQFRYTTGTPLNTWTFAVDFLINDTFYLSSGTPTPKTWGCKYQMLGGGNGLNRWHNLSILAPFILPLGTLDIKIAFRTPSTSTTELEETELGVWFL